MARRPLSILALVALLTQATLGGLLGGGIEGVGFCLGDHTAHPGADRDHETVPAGASAQDDHHRCSHDCGFPTPIPIGDGEQQNGDRHHDGCACTDVELPSLDDPGTPREARLVLDTVDRDDGCPAQWRRAEPAPMCLAWHGPPLAAAPDPGGAHRLALVRSTRRLI